MTTPRTWPENARPTPEQFVQWLEDCTPDDRIEAVARLLDSSQLAAECFTQNHKALLSEVEFLRGQYGKGWADALRAVRGGIAAGYAEETA